MLITATIFILLGAFIKFGKMYFLIAGYNTMSAEKKAKYNIKGIAKMFGNTMFAMALAIILGHLLARWLGLQELESIVFFGTLLVGIPFLLIRSNSSRYKIKNGRSTKNK